MLNIAIVLKQTINFTPKISIFQLPTNFAIKFTFHFDVTSCKFFFDVDNEFNSVIHELSHKSPKSTMFDTSFRGNSGSINVMNV